MERAEQAQAGLFTGWRGVLLAIFCVTMVATGCAEMVAMAGRYGLFGDAQAGRLGIGYHTPPQSLGWVVIDRVDPGGGAARAAIAVGDRVHCADSLVLSSNPPPGTIAVLTVRHAGRNRVARVQYQALAPAGPQFWQALERTEIGGSLFALALGALVLWRGWGSLPALLLGLGLIGSAGSDTLPWWMLGSPLTGPGLVLIVVRNMAMIGLPLFPIVLYHAQVRALPRGWWIATGVVGVMAALAQISLVLEPWLAWLAPRPLRNAELAITLIIVAIACWWSWRGTRDGIASERRRFGILLLAGGLLLAGNAFWMINSDGLDLLGPTARPWLATINLLLVQIAFPLTLTYAMLRHRVVDLGFVLNRTVVFATFSAILLGSFGLIEWGVEHLLPEAWVKASAWIDAGAAVLVYLAFHRVHGAVERRVEHVFFRHWMANENVLRRFVASAAHFEDTRALARAFADELSRFGGDARVAIYRRNEGVLDRVGGTWDSAPRHFRDDDPAFALMRAERAPLDLGETQTDLPGMLALPMLDHGVLAGLVLLDLKGNGALWRPDEVALLGWATHEVGLALAALHAGLIDTENRLLKAQLARLTGIIGDRLDRVGA